MLAALALIGAVTYIGAILLLFDRKWFAAFRGSAAPRPAPATEA
jgi:hypothetical protein